MTTENQNALAMDFTATDSKGKTIKLSDYRGKNNVVLIFNRGFF
jgi:peroxiredoxin